MGMTWPSERKVLSWGKIFLSLALFFCFSLRAQAATIGAFDYELDAATNTATLTGTVFFNVGAVIIPSTVDYEGLTYNVTEIGNFAFDGKGVTSVDIPNGVTVIGDHAFANNLLNAVDIPDSVATIGSFAFFSNPSITSVDLGQGVATIRSSAFEGISATEIVIPSSVKNLDVWAFFYSELRTVWFEGAYVRYSDYEIRSGISVAAFHLSTALENVYACEDPAGWEGVSFETGESYPYSTVEVDTCLPPAPVPTATPYALLALGALLVLVAFRKL